MACEYQEVFKYPINICLNLTNFCVLKCRYCFLHNKPEFMSLDVAKDTIDFLARNLVEHRKLMNAPNRKAEVTFFGGEPTVLWDKIIVPIVHYVEEKYPNQFTFNMTTNGVLLNEDRIKFCYDHRIFLLLSIDGTKEVQDFNRPHMNEGVSSFDLLAPNIPLILKYFPETTFRATLYQPTIDKMFESYLFAESCGFRNIFMCPNAREEWTPENLEKLKLEVRKITTYMTMEYIEGYHPMFWSNLDGIFGDIINIDLQNYTKDYFDLAPNRSVYRCGLGTSSISVAFDGKMYACQEQDSRDTGDYFYIGDIYNGLDIPKHKIILDDYNRATKIRSEKEGLCDGCALRQNCIHQTCPSVSHDMFNDFFVRPAVDCFYDQAMFDGAVQMMNILVNQEKNEIFKEYLDFKMKEGV